MLDSVSSMTVRSCDVAVDLEALVLVVLGLDVVERRLRSTALAPTQKVAS